MASSMPMVSSLCCRSASPQTFRERLVRDDLCEVEERAAHRRGSDAADAGGVLGIEETPGVDVDPGGAVALLRGGDLDARPVRRPELVERRRIAVAQRGLVPDGQDRCQPEALAAQRGVADGIDAAVEG
jgi:hypothetical protein